ncbi:MAG: glycosyltransferase family 39 protein [Deltaproteobacteria bacterium]|nr:glycosyltransferase family 39 protein [Deltaproteobacteria bacterium]MBI3387517.1 glycosyltransferase family 39 protein [Deltaproteobacteria bacterium]
MKRALTIVAIAGLSGAALALRLWHIDFGLPEFFHPDEPIKAQKALAIAAGDLNPHYFWHPSFMLYTTAVAVRLFAWNDGPVDPTRVVLIGRVVNATFGALTIPLTFLLGRAIAGSAVGLGAAALLTVAPLPVFCSHYLKEDAPLTFWIVAAAVAALRLTRRGTTRDYIVAGLLCGAAIATKYTGLLALLLPFLAHRERPGHEPRQLRWLGFAAMIAFITLTPFAVLDTWQFARGVGHEGSNVVTGMATSALSPLPFLWTFHLRYSIAPGLGWLATALALVGFVWALRQPTASYRVVTAFVALGYTIFENSPYKPPPNFDRYVLPLLPFLAVLAMVGVRALRRRVPLLAVAVLAALLIEPTVRSLQLLTTMTPDTRERAAEWLRANLPPGARIILEGQLVDDEGHPVVAYAPHLTKANATYVFSLAQRPERLGEFDYAVASSFMYDRFVRFGAGDPSAAAFYRTLFARPLAAEFAPPTSSYGFHNPTLRVYRLGP